MAAELGIAPVALAFRRQGSRAESGGLEASTGVGWVGGEDRVDLRTSQPLTFLADFGIFSGSHGILGGSFGWVRSVPA
jgi:hypothetical protein